MDAIDKLIKDTLAEYGSSDSERQPKKGDPIVRQDGKMKHERFGDDIIRDTWEKLMAADPKAVSAELVRLGNLTISVSVAMLILCKFAEHDNGKTLRAVFPSDAAWEFFNAAIEEAKRCDAELELIGIDCDTSEFNIDADEYDVSSSISTKPAGDALLGNTPEA